MECMCLKPYIFEETGDFAIVFKPPCMHCVPLKQKEGDTLFDWYAAVSPAIIDSGGGLVHRLDFETQGLVLFAKNQRSLDFLLEQQKEGNVIKEYSAMCQKAPLCSSPFSDSFPPPPFTCVQEGAVIESFFRPFGPGRKQVRPVTDAAVNGKKIAARYEIAKDNNNYYRTTVMGVSGFPPDYCVFTVSLRRGFRHQIRCHLAWIGCPVLNDPLYSTEPANGTSVNDGFLALRANGLFFTDPQKGERDTAVGREYRIEAFRASFTGF